MGVRVRARVRMRVRVSIIDNDSMVWRGCGEYVWGRVRG